ncbi:MAG: hypothetical protein CO105_10820 [Comamonadaceae bacterium CG_4_9_14_3_um_filter_60_33]|nr:MAG: hypothetical protein CO105_10820 [Comamonadaceae bacterium CG_4_9_14_3_um_filter_60_33]
MPTPLKIRPGAFKTLGTWVLGLTLCLTALSGFAAALPANAAPAKYALIIGNSNYQFGKSSLKNPVNDAKLMAQSLQKLGFVTKQFTDLDRAGMAAAVQAFADQLPKGATSVVFYSGHGMQIGGASYLLPVDMAVTSEPSVALRAYPLKKLLERVSASKSSVNIVILDACRDNPFQPVPAVRYRNFRNLGLGPVVAPRGTFVAYSTSPGQLAADGAGANSVYTSTLASALLEPQVPLQTIFRKVGDQVRKKTLDDQIPWFESSISEDYYFLPPEGVKMLAGQPLNAVGASTETASATRQDGTPARSSKNTQTEDAWYRTMSEYEWSRLDYDIAQRVKFMTQDEVPLMEHRAKGGSVVAQTTLGLFWLAGSDRAVNTSTGQVMRYQANNTKAVRWLRQAADAGFPIAQTELGEMLHRGKGIDRDSGLARQLLASAAQAKYTRAKLDLLHIDIEQGKAGGTDIKALMESVSRAMMPPEDAR